MATAENSKHKKRERSGQRRQAARRRVRATRIRRSVIVALVVAVPALWLFEFSGPDELAEAEVIETRRWRHYTNDGKSHPHLAATLEIEGLSEATLEKADGYTRGQRVEVWIQRGRVTNWPRYLDLAKPEEIVSEREFARRVEAQNEPQNEPQNEAQNEAQNEVQNDAKDDAKGEGQRESEGEEALAEPAPSQPPALEKPAEEAVPEER